MYLAKALATRILPEDLNGRFCVAEIPDLGPEKSPKSTSQPGCDQEGNGAAARGLFGTEPHMDGSGWSGSAAQNKCPSTS